MFPSVYEEFIFKKSYARWLDDKGTREDWSETVNRYLGFMSEHLLRKHKYTIPQNLKDELYEAILSFEVMPSMRAMMTAGAALMRDNTAGFNCAFLTVESADDFVETMYILLCGTGVGFSVEREFTDKLPPVPREFFDVGATIVVEDSKEGWAQALRELLQYLWNGYIPQIDVSKVRPAGSRLKVFGGRASGPEPLLRLMRFVIKRFMRRAGLRLRPIDCHDIQCMIGDVVVVGGVRRSAMISLSDLDDDLMAGAKGYLPVQSVIPSPFAPRQFCVVVDDEAHEIEFSDDEFGASQIKMLNEQNLIYWPLIAPYRSLANNSAVYNEKPTHEVFTKEWASLVASGSGERGFFNREASIRQATRFGRRGDVRYGTNPCSEIILRPRQFCNLSEAIARALDTLKNLKRKVRLAAILGTFQSTLTDFPFLRDIWRQNTEEERLLGVSLTGIMDCQLLNGQNGNPEKILNELRKVARDTNREFAKAIGIEPSAAITCVKPSGTVSQLVNSSSGIHTRHARHYIRRIRSDVKDPLAQMMKAKGVPCEPDVFKPKETLIFSFPMKAPEGAITRHDVTALSQLENWLTFQRDWCEHKPSCTVSVRDEEWQPVADWVYENFDDLSGISFLPHYEPNYPQLPYEDITKEQYDDLVKQIPTSIDWDDLRLFEKEDQTEAMQTLACVGGVCEI